MTVYKLIVTSCFNSELLKKTQDIADTFGDAFGARRFYEDVTRSIAQTHSYLPIIKPKCYITQDGVNYYRIAIRKHMVIYSLEGNKMIVWQLRYGRQDISNLRIKR